VAFTIDTAGSFAGSSLDVGFIAGNGASSAGFQYLVLTITEGTAVTTDIFTSIPAAESFFYDNVISLSALPDETDLLIDFNMALTSTGGGDNFNGDLVFGASTNNAPPAFAHDAPRLEALQVRAVPEPGICGLLAGGLALLALQRKNARHV
jgi:hypothetical protein